MKRVPRSEAVLTLKSLTVEFGKPSSVAVPLPEDVRLNPCPFCDSQELHLSVSHDEKSLPGCCVSCEACGYSGKVSRSLDAALEIWNKSMNQDW